MNFSPLTKGGRGGYIAEGDHPPRPPFVRGEKDTVIEKLYEWLDHRISYRKIKDAMLLEHIPGGAKWRYVWGSTSGVRLPDPARHRRSAHDRLQPRRLDGLGQRLLHPV